MRAVRNFKELKSAKKQQKKLIEKFSLKYLCRQTSKHIFIEKEGIDITQRVKSIISWQQK